jgi:hypothetical protein
MDEICSIRQEKTTLPKHYGLVKKEIDIFARAK